MAEQIAAGINNVRAKFAAQQQQQQQPTPPANADPPKPSFGKQIVNKIGEGVKEKAGDLAKDAAKKGVLTLAKKIFPFHF